MPHWTGNRIILTLLISAIIVALILIITYNGFGNFIDHQRRNLSVVKENFKIYTTSNTDKISHHLTLAETYQHGMPDRYDLNGKVIPGVKPDLSKSISHLLDAIKLGHKESYVTIAKMLVYDTQDRPNVELAERCLNQVPNSPRAIEFLERIRGMKEVDVVYPCRECGFPDRYKCPHCKKTTHPGIGHANQSNCSRCNQKLPTDFGRICPGCEQRIEYQRHEMLDRFMTEVHEEPEIPEVRIPNTRIWQHANQNVHDHGVSTGIKRTINIIKAPIDKEQTLDATVSEIRTYAKEHAKGDKLKSIDKVLNTIYNSSGEATSYGMNEIETLMQVWSRVKNSDTHGEDLRDIFMDELASGVEHGNVVCTGGRIGRMVNVFNGTKTGEELGINIVSTDMVKKEMMNKLSVIRNELPEDKNLLDVAKKQFNDEYVTRGLITPDDLDRTLKEWLV